jgi:hypothetical protein
MVVQAAISFKQHVLSNVTRSSLYLLLVICFFFASLRYTPADCANSYWSGFSHPWQSSVRPRTRHREVSAATLVCAGTLISLHLRIEHTLVRHTVPCCDAVTIGIVHGRGELTARRIIFTARIFFHSFCFFSLPPSSEHISPAEPLLPDSSYLTRRTSIF